MVNYPLGLGDTRISVLVTDDSGPQPVVMATYTLHIHREGRPSLPMFGDHVTCSFLQVCQLTSEVNQKRSLLTVTVQRSLDKRVFQCPELRPGSTVGDKK